MVMYFLKSNFRTWTTKLSLAVFYKIKKLAIIEIILLNVTYLSLIFLYCLVIYILFCSIIFKQWIIWLFNIFWSFRSFNIWIFELFFCNIWNCLTNFFKSLHVQAMASSSNCNTNWTHTRANHAINGVVSSIFYKIILVYLINR